MEIIKGIKLKGYPAEIPNCSRDDLPQFFLDMGFKKGVEIGTYKGKFTKKFAEKGLEIYGIDPYKPYSDFDIVVDNRTERQNELFNMATEILKPYENAKIIRKMSMEALEDFEDESLDFVYIDGNHRFKWVAEDIYEWSKKVKKGGVVSGHDYIHPKRLRNRWDSLQVKFIVDAYLQAFRIKNWYLLGEQDAPAGDRRDRFRSWMWIKK